MKYTRNNFVFAAFLCLLVYFACGFFLDQQFSVNAITIPSIENAVVDVEPKQHNDLKTYFQKPFTYLDRGHQSFVFISADKNIVVKFFDARGLKQTSLIPFYSQDQIERSVRRLKVLLDGYHLAYEKDLQNSGLLFVQLAPNPQLELSSTFNDRFGFPHKIDLSKVLFVVQRTATTTRKEISNLLDMGDVAAVKNRFTSIIEMYVDEYSRGLYDRDRNIIDNTGFIAGHPVRIDLGRLHYDEAFRDSRVFVKDLYNVVYKRADRFLSKYYPEYREELLESILKHIEKYMAG